MIILPIRHVENYSDLSEEEAKEMFELVDEISDVIKSKFGEDAIIHINKGKHGSERHIHLHIVPSKGNLRQLMSKYENILEKKDILEKEMDKMREKIVK
jgi:diadenosine tetraphosphate (Ap4A) HIT family hydrolase